MAETPPPYGTYSTVKNTIERFKDATVPTKLNRHVLDDVAGGAFSALMTSLRFLGLVNEDQTVRAEFRELVEAKRKSEEDYRDRLTQVVSDAYQPIIGTFDLDAGTLPELEKKFKDAGVPQGQMVTKAIRFYLKALEDAGLTVSEHITKQRPTGKRKNTNGEKKTKKTAAKKTGGGAGVKPAQDELKPDFDRLPVPGIDGAFIQYPKNLTDANCTMFEAMMTVLRTYAKSRNGGGKKS